MRPIEPGCLCLIIGTEYSDGKVCTAIKHHDNDPYLNSTDTDMWETDTQFFYEIIECEENTGIFGSDNLMFSKNLLRIDPDPEFNFEEESEEQEA